MRILENRVKIDVRFQHDFCFAKVAKRNTRTGQKMHTWASTVIKKFKIKSKIQKKNGIPHTGIGYAILLVHHMVILIIRHFFVLVEFCRNRFVLVFVQNAHYDCDNKANDERGKNFI